MNGLAPIDAHKVVYQCDLKEHYQDDPVIDAAIRGFVEAHGINPRSLMIGGSLHAAPPATQKPVPRTRPRSSLDRFVVICRPPFKTGIGRIP